MQSTPTYPTSTRQTTNKCISFLASIRTMGAAQPKSRRDLEVCAGGKAEKTCTLLGTDDWVAGMSHFLSLSLIILRDTAVLSTLLPDDSCNSLPFFLVYCSTTSFWNAKKSLGPALSE